MLSKRHQIEQTLKFMAHCLSQSLRHPKTEIVYIGNPRERKSNPAPWFLSFGVLMIGVGLWCLSYHWDAPELAEASRPLVYLPLGNMFGMGVQSNAQKSS